MSLKHRVTKVYMKVTSKTEGIARFVTGPNGEKPDKELTTVSYEFKNRQFSGHNVGQLLLVTFRISPNGRRFLLNSTPVDEKGMAVRAEEIKEKSSVVGGFYYPPDVRRVFTAAHKMALDKEMGSVVLMMVGPSGYGKTTLPQKFAELTGRGHVRINCAGIRDPEEWFGFREAREGSTVFDPSEFAQRIQEGHSVVVLDEVNRLEPWLHNTLFPLLDDDHKTVIRNLDFVVAPDTIFVMTVNQGIEFTGTFEMDQAFMNRVHAVIHVGPPPPKEEVEILLQRTDVDQDIASKIVDVATALREVAAAKEVSIDCSTRAALRIAMLNRVGLPLRIGFHDVIEAAALDAEVQKKLADIINSRLGVYESVPLFTDDVFDVEEDDG